MISTHWLIPYYAGLFAGVALGILLARPAEVAACLVWLLTRPSRRERKRHAALREIGWCEAVRCECMREKRP